MSRCPLLLVSFAIVVSLIAAPAMAQGSGKIVDVHATKTDIEVLPGDAAKFALQITSREAVLSHNVILVADNVTAGWTYNVTPEQQAVAAGKTVNFTLTLFPPADVQAGAAASLLVRARDKDTGFTLSDPRQLNVTVVAPVVTPPPAESNAAPALRLTTGDASARPGETASGTITLTNDGTARLDVDLTVSGPTAWNARIREFDQHRVLHPGADPATVPVFATVPEGARPGTQAFTVTATVDGHKFTATWTVTILAAPAQEAAPAGSEPKAAPADNETAATPSAEPDAPGLTLSIAGEVDVAPGSGATGIVRLRNTGNTPLVVTLAGSAPEGWSALRFAQTSVPLEAGESRDIIVQVDAPADVFAGGAARGTIVATTANGLMRSTALAIQVVEASDPEPLPPTKPAAAQQADSPLTITPTEWGAAAALATVGAGALALMRRPLREKLLWGAVGLYTRLARPDVLGHDEREKLYRIIEEKPGVHFHALQRELSWNTGTLTYHVRVLERHGFVVSRRDGLYRRFFVAGAAPRKETFEGPTGLRADVLEAITNQHGLSQGDLTLALGANKQTVNYHVKALERAGMIRIEKRGRETFLYPAGAPGGEATAVA